VNHSYPTCIAHAKPTKETKLRELQEQIVKTTDKDMEINNKVSFTLVYMERLVSILLEEEY